MRVSARSSGVCSSDLGHTPSQTGERIAHALKTLGVFLQPSVNVLVTEYRSKTVAVLGAVSKPGEIALDRQGLTIADVLARAGATFGSGAMIVTVIGAQDGKPTREAIRVADLLSGGDRKRTSLNSSH